MNGREARERAALERNLLTSTNWRTLATTARRPSCASRRSDGGGRLAAPCRSGTAGQSVLHEADQPAGPKAVADRWPAEPAVLDRARPGSLRPAQRGVPR